MRYILSLLLIACPAAFGEVIRVHLLEEPCTPQCSEKLEAVFRTNASFTSAHVLSKYRFIELNALEWVQDARLKEIVKAQGFNVLTIKRSAD